MPKIADDWGELEYYNSETGIISRRGKIFKPGGDQAVEISIMLSPNGLMTYNRALAGVDKQEVMDNAFGDWLDVKGEQIQEYIKEGKSVAFVEIKFGGRAFNLPRWMRRKLGFRGKTKVISLKNQRVNDCKSPTSWGINCWGWDPVEYNENRVFTPMSNKEKKGYQFVKMEEYIKIKGIDYFVGVDVGFFCFFVSTSYVAVVC